VTRIRGMREKHSLRKEFFLFIPSLGKPEQRRMKPNLPPWPCIFEARRSRQRSEDSRRNPKRPKAQNRREEFQERKNSRTGFVCLCWPFVPESDNGPCPTVNRGLWAEKSRHQTDYIRVTQLLPPGPLPSLWSSYQS